ncbi:hypothetical protein QYF36_007256 [Acer negundo]|nr:hypothetical protein QYF36_007256 [Acer negundo]
MGKEHGPQPVVAVENDQGRIGSDLDLAGTPNINIKGLTYGPESDIKGAGISKICLTDEGIGPTVADKAGQSVNGSCGLLVGKWK